MGRKRRVETVPHGVGSSSTRESVVPPLDQQGMEATSEASDASEASTQNQCKNKRGKTRMENVWSVPIDRRIPVVLNDLGQPVGDNAQILTNFVGIVVRHHCPFNYESWLKVPDGTKLYLKSLIQAKFTYPPHMDHWLGKKLGERFRDYKCALKKAHFSHFQSNEDNLANCPPDLQPDYWHFLVNFFSSGKGKRLEEIGKSSRESESPSHTTGSMSTARKQDQMEKEAGEKVGQIEVFHASHLRKNGTYIDQQVPEIVAKANARKAKIPESSSVNMRLAEIEALDLVLKPERKGILRGVGTGPTRTSLFGRQAKISTDVEVENVKREMAAQQDRFDNEIKELKEQMKREREEQKRERDEQNAQMRMLLQQVQGMQKGKSAHGNRQTAGQQRSYSSRSSYETNSDANR